MKSLAAALVSTLAFAAPVNAQESPAPDAPPSEGHEQAAPVPPPEPGDGLTSDVWEYDKPIAFHWTLLNLPERALELALSPLGILVAEAEERRLDKRFKDFFSYFDGRIKISPRFKVAFGDGLGVGAKVKYKERLDARTEAALGAVYRLNGDYLIDSTLEQPVGTLNDRTIHARASIVVDQNERFYGLGGGSVRESRRVLTNNDQQAVVGIDLQPKDWYDYAGKFELGIYRQTLAPGVDAPNVPVGAPGDLVGVPPGFDESTLYALANLIGTYDTRDTHGRPSRGLQAHLGVDGLIDVSGGGLAGARFHGGFRWYLPVLPEARTLIVFGGAAAAVPLYPGAEIPLQILPSLGRENHLRGYDRVRFRDKYAFWGGAEYRFPIFEYLNTDVGIDTFVFAEGGTAFGDDALEANRLRYSTGGGIRVGHETVMVSELVVGFSREGFQIFIGREADF